MSFGPLISFMKCSNIFEFSVIYCHRNSTSLLRRHFTSRHAERNKCEDVSGLFFEDYFSVSVSLLQRRQNQFSRALICNVCCCLCFTLLPPNHSICFLPTLKVYHQTLICQPYAKGFRSPPPLLQQASNSLNQSAAKSDGNFHLDCKSLHWKTKATMGTQEALHCAPIKSPSDVIGTVWETVFAPYVIGTTVSSMLLSLTNHCECPPKMWAKC